MKKTMDHTIDRAVNWETTRIKPNGQINLRGTMRTCVEDLWTSGTTAAHLDPGDIIRAFVLWGHLRSEPRLLRLAVLVDSGNKRYGNTCPRSCPAIGPSSAPRMPDAAPVARSWTTRCRGEQR